MQAREVKHRLQGIEHQVGSESGQDLHLQANECKAWSVIRIGKNVAQCGRFARYVWILQQFSHCSA